MKGVIVAALVLGAVCGLVALNAVYVRHVTDGLLDKLDALPDAPDAEQTPNAVQEIIDYLERHTTGLCLSLNYALPDRVGEQLAALKSYARLGDTLQYAATLAVLRDACRDLARAERFDIKSIL